jgi:two-component sensor histidine kinase
MHSTVNDSLHQTAPSISFLETVEQQMGIVADLSRADILLYAQKSAEEVVIVAHAQPHSLAHVYSESRTGRIVSKDHRPEVPQVFTSGKPQKAQRTFIAEGAPVVRQAFPICYPPVCAPLSGEISENGKTVDQAEVVAVLVIVTNLIEYERHRLRSRVFRRALKRLQAMLLCGQIVGAEELSTFGEQDGIIFTDNEGIIRYASGVATNLYRRVGYKETIEGHHLSDLETGDELLWSEVLGQQRCLEWESEEADRFWIRKGIPLVIYPPTHLSWLKLFARSGQIRPGGVLILLDDATEARRREEENRIKNAMIQEVHHRVKNNLQTIAGLLRMQARRVQSEEARLALDEALNRVLSVAVIHEFLSSNSSNIINIKEVSNRILQQFKHGMLSPDRIIGLELTGEPIYLPARQATACALIINELVQNAVEHGFEQKQEGLIQVNLEDTGDEVIITVADNGLGVPAGFKMGQAESLGLHIVKILVEDDLKGNIELEKGIDNGQGLSVKISFSKTIFRGEKGWTEHVSL